MEIYSQNFKLLIELKEFSIAYFVLWVSLFLIHFFRLSSLNCTEKSNYLGSTDASLI